MVPAASMKDLSAILAQVPSGAWVAISQDGSRVVAFGPEMRDVIEQARQSGEDDPIITRVPQSNMALIL